MKQFAYVILHYKNMKDTLDCIHSIQEKTDSPIVIVDNHTLSTSDQKKLSRYTKDIILLEDNLGFAKANNIGIRYAWEHYHPDFVVVINNDIVITQPDFESQIVKSYQKSHFDMFGPRIDTDGGDSVNPFPVYSSLEEVEKAISRTKRNIRLFSSPLQRSLFRIYHNIKYKIVPIKHLKNGLEARTGIGLHGCALVFSKKYLKKYPDAFYNETFLYHEEEFLYYRMKQDHLISYYDPNVYCFHKEGSSLNFSFQNNYYEKELFRNKEILSSLTKLYDLMVNDQKKKGSAE